MKEKSTRPWDAVPYKDLRNTIEAKLKKTIETLKKQGYDSQNISPKEFYDYLTGETPTGDIITIVDILQSEYFMIHEVVEISELKKINVPINKQTVMNFYPKVYAAHLVATEHEMNSAFDKKDQNWIKLRLSHAEGWLDDTLLPKELLRKCKSTIKKMETLSSKLENQKSKLKDSHNQAVSYIVSKCRKLPVISLLGYGSYARGDYRPDSDIDLLTVLDSNCYSSKDLKKLVDICHHCRKKFDVRITMDFMLDSEIDLWNKGILLEGHSFIDLSFYNKQGKILLGTDIRNRFKIPKDLEQKAHDLLGIIEAEFKRWFLECEDRKHHFPQYYEGETDEKKGLVPHWMTGWLLITFLNTQKIVEATSFEETCRLLGQFPLIANTSQFKKYRQKKELTPDEFIKLYRIIRMKARRQETSLMV